MDTAFPGDSKLSTAASKPETTATVEEQIVDLRNPLLAAALALLWPGLGHLYQRRTGKGLLLMVCILGTYFYGWTLAGGKVTYAAWNPRSIRQYGYLCQFWVGLPAWPALVQASSRAPLGENFMNPPRMRGNDEGDSDLSVWYRKYSGHYELGAVLTMIAGLLNVLAIFDAAAGPIGASAAPEGARDDKKPPPGKPSEGGAS